jgi:MFS family permease
MFDPRIKAMLPLFAAVFIDIFSFGLMYPVIVALFHDPAVVGVYRPALREVYLSLAFSLFPLGMFFGASLLGDLSDALGRKRTLMLCMAGLAVAYALMWLAVETRELLLFLAGRLMSGLMAGTGPIAQAAMMDRSTDEERGRDLSMVVFVNCVGLVVGPMAGGVLSHLDLRAPLAFALVLCLAALALIGLAPLADGVLRPLRLSWRRPVELFVRALRHPTIGPLALTFLLFQLGFALYYIYILVIMQRVYGLTSLELGLFSATMGLGFVIGTTVVYNGLAARLKNERRVAGIGCWACGIGILVAAAPLPVHAQWALAFVVAAANLPAFVGLLALISDSASADEQGWALGIGAAMTALAFFVAGLAAALLTMAVPIWLLLFAGGLIVLAATVTLRRTPAVRPALAGK